MAAEVDPTLFEHLDDSPTEADSLPAHKYRKCTDNNTPDLGEKPPTPRSKLVRENARVHFELPEEIPDSQESLDLSDTPNELEDNSFHTEETVVLAQGTQITLKPKPKYVSPKTSLSLVLLIALLLQVRTLTRPCLLQTVFFHPISQQLASEILPIPTLDLGAACYG